MSTGLMYWQLFKSLKSVFRTVDRQLSHNTALISKQHRETYLRQYPVTLVLPDGSTYRIRYHEPRLMVNLPLDLAELSPDEVKMRLEKRRPKKKVEVAREEKESFHSSKYIKYVKKNKK